MFWAGFYETTLTEDAISATDASEGDLHRLLGAFRDKIKTTTGGREKTRTETRAGFDGIMITRRWVLNATDDTLGPAARTKLNATFAACAAHLGR